ncbi:hypothetical protein D3C84_891340 [compost metagenome]
MLRQYPCFAPFTVLVGNSTELCVEIRATARTDHIGHLIGDSVVVRPNRAVLEQRSGAVVAMGSDTPHPAAFAVKKPSRRPALSTLCLDRYMAFAAAKTEAAGCPCFVAIIIVFFLRLRK